MPLSPAEREQTPGLAELQDLTRVLGQLLDDPHPGLFTWRKALAGTIAKIAEFGGQ